MSDQISLIVNGLQFIGWKRAEITRGIEAISGDFVLEFADRWSESQEIFGINEGDSCVVRIGEEAVITGYVDTVDVELSADSHTNNLTGRDKTGDLVDCSADHSPDEWKNIKLTSLVNILALPFGIEASAAVDTGDKFPVFKLQPGESAFEAVDRACRMRAVLPVPDGAGNITITRRGTTPAKARLVQGQNVLRARKSADSTERYSQYKVLGQQGGKTLDGWTDTTKRTQVLGTAADSKVARYRPLTVLAESQADLAAARKRAQWEATVRAARAVMLEVDVQGFRQTTGGPLWQPNIVVSADVPKAQVKTDFLITRVRYQQSLDQGSITTLTLMASKAFDPQPDIVFDVKAETIKGWD